MRPLPHLPHYAELHCRTNYSFLTGASHPAELIEQAKQLGYEALAVTDECSLAGVVRALDAAETHGLPLIIGSEMRLTLPGASAARRTPQGVEGPNLHTAPLRESALTALPPSLPQRPDPAPAKSPKKPLAPATRHQQSRSQPPRDMTPQAVAQAVIMAAQASAASMARAGLPLARAKTGPQADTWPGDAASPPGRQARAERLPHAGATGRPVGATESQACEPMRPHARLVILAQTRRGYGNLSQWITLARRRAEKGGYIAHPGDVEGKAPGAPLLTGLPECLALLVPDASQSFKQIHAHAMWLKRWLQDRAWIAIELHGRASDDALIRRVRRVAAFTGLRIVAAGDVLMHARSRKPLQDVLNASRLNRPVSECGLQLTSNAEQYLRPRDRLAQLYDTEWLENTLAVAAQCTFSLRQLAYEYPQEIVPPGETPDSHLRQLTEEGVRRRFPGGMPSHLRDTIEKEFALIAQLDYARFFLTVADIVRWARERKILCQGRGSAANSVVCYCLGVTEVDPLVATLLFERFLSIERNEPPDIDVDFEHQRREEVIQYIYQKYGRHRAALTAVVICYRPRSAVRDVGRALGIDLQRIEAVAKSQHWFDGRRIDPERLRQNGFDPDAPLVKLWAELTQQLIGFPRHLSQHPGGFVIAAEEMSELVPVENAAMDGRSVIQWDKDDLDVLRLLKVDILALGMLSALKRSFDLLGRKIHRPITMGTIPQGDVPTYDMICKADTIGVFQIESRAQMSMLPRLRPRNYYDLVVEVAIVRPGPIEGGMVHPYLRNRGLPLNELNIRPELMPALARTCGVPIFQEQVMQIAMLAADFTAGEADQLRRAMAAWKRKGGLEGFEDKLIGRMLANGYEKDYADRIFKQIKGFGEYGFPESHAASFALLVYISSWIKRHHPDVFLAALLNSQPMGFYAPAQLVRDARAHGVEVLPVDVRCSLWDTDFEAPQRFAAVIDVMVTSAMTAAEGESEADGPTTVSNTAHASIALDGHVLQPLRLGLNRIAGLAEDSGRRIVDTRADGPFAGIEDLARRARLSAHDLQALAEADALQGIAGHRHQAAWGVAGVDTRPTEMLRATRVHEAAAELAAPSEAEDMHADYRALGLSLKRHPLALVRDQLDAFRVQTAAVLHTYPAGRIARASGLVTHRQRPETAKGTIFVTLEDDTGAVNVIVWPAVAEAQRQPLLAARLLTVYGQWQRQGEVMHLLAAKLIDHTALLEGLVTRSRDFR